MNGAGSSNPVRAGAAGLHRSRWTGLRVVEAAGGGRARRERRTVPLTVYLRSVFGLRADAHGQDRRRCGKLCP